MRYFTSTNQIHYLFLFILSLNYLIPIVIFGEPTLFYIDSLDSEIVYNLILGKILIGNFDSVKIFLNGEISPLYLRRLFQPYSFFYSIFSLELAYWIIDILVKLVSYFSFLILSKKINSNIFICCLVSCLYASSNLPTHEGFGLAIIPYIIYLSLFKKKLKIKHYILIVFFGINSDLLFGGFAVPSIVLVLLLLIDKHQLIQFLKIFLTFSVSILFANFNLLYLLFSNIEFHRAEILREMFSLKESIISFLKFLFPLPNTWSHKFFMILPISLFAIPAIIFSFFSKDDNIKKILLGLILSILFIIIIQNNFIGKFVNETYFKKISWGYLGKSFNLLYCFLIIYLLKSKNLYSKILFFLVITSILFFQINSSIVPIYKDKIIKEENYQNLYTFKGFYSHYDYKKIKSEVKEHRVLSVGVDPMVAVKNNIFVLDGYHSLYPLSYKRKFREIIENELDKNPTFKNYYDNWGSRVYTSLYEPADKENYSLNLLAAEKLGAKYIISKFPLQMSSLKLILSECEADGLCLYKINN